MTRVMYFESNRSSQEGMIAVGTVVMNRMHSGRYPDSVCGVVGQKNQFAPGVLSKPMGKGRELAAKTAKMVLRGKKHARVGKAMFFHTAGYSFPYSNMHYVAIAGGNAFYEKRKDAHSSQAEIARRDSAPSAAAVRSRGTIEPRQRTFDPVWTGEADTPVQAPPLVQSPSSSGGGLTPMRIEDLILEGAVIR